MKFQENISLKPYNSFGVEASTRYFAEATTIDELIDILQQYHASEDLHSLLILGGGSNILLTENFQGLTILLNLKGKREKILNDEEVLVTALAGENWHQFVQFCLEKNYGGLENLSLIPGNVGTSPMQNIGAYGVEIKDSFHQCKALNIDSLTIETFNLEQCKFGYRDSFFKQKGKGKYIILEVTFRLKTKNHELHTEYGSIAKELEGMSVQNIDIQLVSKTVIAIRESKLPNPKETGNAGSFFKNPVISESEFEKIQKNHPEIPFYKNSEGVKIPAGWLIEKSGWKGKQIGNVATHHLQALVIINKTGNASGREIFEFSAMIIDSVKEQFGIELEREVNII